jgi:hypothetical protein
MLESKCHKNQTPPNLNSKELMVCIFLEKTLDLNMKIFKINMEVYTNMK